MVVDRRDAERIALSLPRPDEHERAVLDIVAVVARAAEDGLEAQQRELLAAHGRDLAAADALDPDDIARLQQDFAHRAARDREILSRRANHQARDDRQRHRHAQHDREPPALVVAQLDEAADLFDIRLDDIHADPAARD